jgi:hypothetical protein
MSWSSCAMTAAQPYATNRPGIRIGRHAPTLRSSQCRAPASIFRAGGLGDGIRPESLNSRVFGIETCIAVPCRQGWVGVSQGRWSFGSAGQGVVAVRGRRRADGCQALVIVSAQRQVDSMRSRVRRASRVIRTATCSTRSRNAVISARASSGALVNPMSLS